MRPKQQKKKQKILGKILKILNPTTSWHLSYAPKAHDYLVEFSAVMTLPLDTTLCLVLSASRVQLSSADFRRHNNSYYVC